MEKRTDSILERYRGEYVAFDLDGKYVAHDRSKERARLLAAAHGEPRAVILYSPLANSHAARKVAEWASKKCQKPVLIASKATAACLLDPGHQGECEGIVVRTEEA